MKKRYKIVLKILIMIDFKKKWRQNMAINQLEATLQASTHTIAKLEKEGCDDEKMLKELRKERDRILDELNLN